ncbi:unnamed protein product [Arctia plantaginis]|uniref:Uncharacterized protein n=1 Tax=Arctia plantaginis TaxID=874455 RepID=A0A8S1BCT4_ARCPL|nr:unnamed protein product [Arctia plantaginis]
MKLFVVVSAVLLVLQLADAASSNFFLSDAKQEYIEHQQNAFCDAKPKINSKRTPDSLFIPMVLRACEETACDAACTALHYKLGKCMNTAECQCRTS